MANNGEYFSKAIKFVGKHAEFIDALWEQNNIKNSYVRTLYELYGLSAITGLKLKRKAVKDTSSMKVRNLQAEALYGYKTVLIDIMHMVLLLDDDENISTEDKVRRAFTPPKDVEECEKAMELFDSYVRGGIEFLYEELIERPLSNEDDFTDVKVANIIALINNKELLG